MTLLLEIFPTLVLVAFILLLVSPKIGPKLLKMARRYRSNTNDELVSQLKSRRDI